jgi:hypothetical protein
MVARLLPEDRRSQDRQLVGRIAQQGAVTKGPDPVIGSQHTQGESLAIAGGELGVEVAGSGRKSLRVEDIVEGKYPWGQGGAHSGQGKAQASDGRQILEGDVVELRERSTCSFTIIEVLSAIKPLTSTPRSQ